MQMLKDRKDVLRYPRLDTVLMVEETIRKLDYYPTKNQLWKALPKQVMYQTFSLIIDYLEELGKIVIHNGEIVWIWNPERVKEYMKKKKHLMWRRENE